MTESVFTVPPLAPVVCKGELPYPFFHRQFCDLNSENSAGFTQTTNPLNPSRRGYNRAMARPNPRRNITRVDLTTASGRYYGWEVRMARRGKRICKFFSDSSFGGNRAALVAAKQFRDEIDQSLPTLTVRERAKNPSKRNRSGIVGLRLERRVQRRGDYEFRYTFWVAQWTDGKGQRKTRAFSVDRHGAREAYRRALHARRQGLRRASGIEPIP
jgi:hypothetical protein